MFNTSDVMDAIIAACVSDPYINGELSGMIYFGQIPQQAGSSQTIMPYCSFYSVSSEIDGAFGGYYLDNVILQASVWTTSMETTSDLIQAIGELFNNYRFVLTDGNTLVEMHRNSSARVVVNGQDQNEAWIYQGSVDLAITTSGC